MTYAFTVIPDLIPACGRQAGSSAQIRQETWILIPNQVEDMLSSDDKKGIKQLKRVSPK